MLKVVTLVLLVAALVRGQPVGYDSANCGNNDCFEDPAGPICYDGKCMECNPAPGGGSNSECMCGPNEYCSGDPNDNDNYGTCVSYGEPLGERCDPALGLGQVEKGKNEKLYCGKLLFKSDNTVDNVEWTGFCNAGKCVACSIGQEKCSGNNGYRCILNNWAYAPADTFSWAYLFVNPVCFSTFWAWMWLYIFFPLVVVGIFVCKKVGIC